MDDFLFITIIVAFFAASFVVVALFDALLRGKQ